jgi:cyclopropane fatty-acyl-phospholipid synthase-like methyltransferase
MPGLYWVWQRSFPGSAAHWRRHYQRGGDSGPGSYGESAEYKSRLINHAIHEHGIRSIIELGCGDGNQLSYVDIEEYIGLDISKDAIARCHERYKSNDKRSFIWYDQNYFHDPLHIVSADCAISLDVIFHLTEDDVFARYMTHLFNCGRRFVMIYALDRDKGRLDHVSVRYRKFSDYIVRNFPEFRVSQYIPANDVFGDFYLFERRGS